MDECFRGVSPMSNFNANPLNPFSPYMHGWVEPIALRQMDLVALQATRVSEQGQMVREQIAQALRVLSKNEVTNRSARRRNKHELLFQEALMERPATKKMEADDDPPTLSPSPSTWETFKTSPCMPAPRAHVENTCARGAGIHGVFRVSHTTPHHTPPQQHDHHITRRQTQRERQREKRRRKRRRQENRREKREVRRLFFSVVVHGRFLLV